jgi:hypothetical protein
MLPVVVSNQSLVSPPLEVVQERDRCFDAITREYCPIGFVENLLALQAARDAARMLRGERLLDALEARAIAALAPVVASNTGPDIAPRGEDFPEVYVSKPFELLSRTAHRNAKSFHENVQRLRETQAERILSSVSIRERDPRFIDELSCIQYLVRRFQLGHQRCRVCGSVANGCWIAPRKAWECNSCHAQTGLRFGTLMARSPVPIADWFHSVRIVLFQPRVRATELGKLINIRRVATASGMLKKIKAALLADDISQLAGLDQVYSPST